MIYINGKYKGNSAETIDTAENRKEAKYLLNEYRSAYGPQWNIYTSQRECK